MTDGLDTPEEIETEAKAELQWLCRIFGEPRALLRRLPHARWRRLRTWIRTLEALAARLIRMLATAVDVEPASSTSAFSSRSSPRPFGAGPCTADPNSERWTGVSLRMPVARPSAPKTSRRRSFGKPYFPDGARSARGLALRLEALIRVFENPMRRARRWARRQARPAAAVQPVRRRTPPGSIRIRWLGPPLRAPVRWSG